MYMSVLPALAHHVCALLLEVRRGHCNPGSGTEDGPQCRLLTAEPLYSLRTRFLCVKQSLENESFTVHHCHRNNGER